MQLMKRGRLREAFISVGVSLVITFATLLVLEIVLRVANFAELRETLTASSLAYDYDAELGWMPVPNSSGTITSFRTTHYKHNSLGLRDEEFTLDGKPTILFLGDSFVWGLDSEAGERFTELLKPKILEYKILAAGVSGFGTDQEYLLLQRLWPKVKPSVVVLIFCAQNDRLDNTTNIRYHNYYKPYFATQPDGSMVLMGQPVPKSQLIYYRDNWWVRNLWLARLATDGYVRFRYPAVSTPDPSERLVVKIRDYVEANGGKFFVGIQYHDGALTTYLEAKGIPFVKLDGIPAYTQGFGPHWTPEGQKIAADRIFDLLSANHVVHLEAATENN
jgi:hypothetical protein